MLKVKTLFFFFRQDYANYKREVLSPATFDHSIYNVLLVGNVGAGKSSLVNMICTVTDPDQDNEILHPAVIRRVESGSTTFQVKSVCQYRLHSEPVMRVKLE